MIDRRKRVVAAVLVLIGIAAALAYAATTGQARTSDNGGRSIVGSWHITVQVDGSPTPFDTLYVFNRDGGGLRIDGRNNAPGVVEWTQDSQDRDVMTIVLFSFDASGKRVGTITSHQVGRVRDGVLEGTFSATGVDLAGNALPGFPKTGTFTGERIVPEAP